MPRYFHRYWWLAIVLPLSGCADNPMVMKGQLQKIQQQQTALSRQNQEMQDRAASLDRDNQEMGSLLAQARQRNQLLEDQLTVLRDQLGTATTQLTQAREQKQASDSKVQTLNASLQRRGGVVITPNNSLLQQLPAINNPEVQVRRDGDVIRIEIPGNRLFENGTARLTGSAVRLLGDVTSEVRRCYPEQILGVEGHTDNDPPYGGQWRSNHELSAARAMAVQDVLVNQLRLPPNQIFIVGHGSNHPIVSNATPAGKERNRRIELVVYPEKASR